MRWVMVIIVWLSLAMAAAWSALWIRSHCASDLIEFSSPYGFSVAGTCRGGVILLTQPFATPSPWQWHRAKFGDPPQPFQAAFGPGEPTWFGIRHGSYFTSMAHNAYAIVIPMWLFVAASSLPAAGILLFTHGPKLIAHPRGRGFEPIVRSANVNPGNSQSALPPHLHIRIPDPSSGK
ncbi:MAG: hypothetical protein ACHRHE_12650 [Tepidisphaerales bacterium]